MSTRKNRKMNAMGRTNLLFITFAAACTLSLGTGGTGQALGASSTWTGGTDTNWATGTNWDTGTAPGNTTGLTTSTTDDATFGASGNLQVNPDANRRIHDLIFTSDAGNYIIGPTTGANTLYLQGNIVGNSANTITFNAPIRTIGNTSITATADETFNFKGLYSLAFGQTLSTGGSGTINFDGGFSSVGSTTSPRANIRLGGTPTVNFNASSPDGQRVGITFMGGQTANLNAEHVIFGDTGNGGPGNRAYSLLTGGKGTLNVNAEDAIYGTAALWAGDATSGTTSVVTINHDQAYTGRLSTGTHPGIGFGTLVGNVDYVSDNSINGPNLGADGYTTTTNATAFATLLVNNNNNNAGASHIVGGSATGNSDVNIVTGVLGGNGFIANTDVTIDTTTYAQGVTLHKRTNTTNGSVTYGKLSPGAAAGAIGTLTMNLGSKGLNIAAAVVDANSQTLLFDLAMPGNSDQVALLGDTVLHIGSGGLDLGDFVFNTTGTPGSLSGTYTLFATDQAIDGTLGSNLTGLIGTSGQMGTLSLANSNQDIVLTIAAVPEPASAELLLLGLGGLLMLVKRRREGVRGVKGS